MFKWRFHILIFASGKYQNKERPLKRQRKLGLQSDQIVNFKPEETLDHWLS